VELIRSGYDFADELTNPVTQYGIYRRVDTVPPVALGGQIDGGVVDRADEIPPLPGVESTWSNGTRYVFGTAKAGIFPPGTWALVATVPATQTDTYLAEVTTAADSSASGTNHAVFVVTTHTTIPSQWFISPVDSGYSVDNIAPGVPQNLAAAYYTGSGNQLSWDANTEDDFQYYRVYRDTDPDFVPLPGNLVEGTAVISWIDIEYDGGGVYYKVTAVDDADNESAPASPGTVTMAPGTTVPQSFVLHQNTPNPFNPATTIRYHVARGGGKVTLQIFAVSGQLVRTLVNGVESEGQRSVTWDGRDGEGASVATGAYFYRLTASGFAQTRKMLLLK